MTNEELEKRTKQWSQQYFHRPFSHQIFFNRRLKTTGGRYHLVDHHIDINPLMLSQFDEENLKKVVLHELCHYHLHLMGADYHHRSAVFKQLLQQVGGLRYAPSVATVQRHVIYECQNCHMRFTRSRHLNTKRYVCGRCGGKLTEINIDL
jgi:SprT-like protein